MKMFSKHILPLILLLGVCFTISCKKETHDQQPQNLANITSFSANGYQAEINQEKGEITVYVPIEVDLSNVTVGIVKSTDSQILPQLENGQIVDFSVPQEFTVTSGDKSATKKYVITVLYRQNTIKNAYVEYAGNKYQASIDHTIGLLTLNIPKSVTDYSAIKPIIELYDGATLSPATNLPINLSQGREATYTINYKGHIKVYRVIAQPIQVKIETFALNINGEIFTGAINHVNKTIRISVPFTTNLSALTPTLTHTANSNISPASGTVQNFTSPVNYTVSNPEESITYTVTVSNQPLVGFLSVYNSPSAISNPDEKKAYDWFETTFGNDGQFISIADINKGKNLSLFKVIWWHNDEFINLPQSAIDASAKIKEHYLKGNHLLLTTFANAYVGLLGISKDGKSPNAFYQNTAPVQYVWGQGLSVNGNTAHPIFTTGVDIWNFGDGIDRVYLIYDNTWRREKQAIWTIGTGSEYSNLSDWQTKTGAIDLAGAEWEGSRATMIHMAEFPKNIHGNNEGAVISIGSPAYDWKVDREGQSGYVANLPLMQKNIEKVTENSIKYLLNK